jgi:hypothetical protein
MNAYRSSHLSTSGQFSRQAGHDAKVRESYPCLVSLALQKISACSDYPKDLLNAVESLDLVSSVR